MVGLKQQQKQGENMNTFSVIGKSPASSKDRKSTYFSTTLSGYTPSWRKMVATMTVAELASELEMIGTDSFLATQKAKRTFKPTDAVSDSLGEAQSIQDYNAPDDY
jgi:hypothetical protein